MPAIYGLIDKLAFGGRDGTQPIDHRILGIDGQREFEEKHFALEIA